MTQISVAITTFNRFEYTVRSIEQILSHPGINEFVIVDDKSTDGSFLRLVEHYSGNIKVKLFQNYENVNMSLNKEMAISRCSSEWVLIGDSDNIFKPDYIDALFKMQPFEKNTIYNAAWAKERFDFRQHQGKPITRHNVAQLMNDPMFRCACNVCNYLVNRESYCDTYTYDPKIKGADTIHFLYHWLESGKQFFIVPNATYEHSIHDGSHFMEHVHINMGHALELEQKIRELR